MAACLLVIIAFLLTQRNRLRKFAKRRAESIANIATRFAPNQFHQSPHLSGGPTIVTISSGVAEETINRGDSSFSVVVAAGPGGIGDDDSSVIDSKDKRLAKARMAAPRDLARNMSRRLKPISSKIDKRVNFLWSILVSIEASTTLRILVSLFQVIGGISKNFGDIYPEVFAQIASAFNALSAEIFYNIDFACVINTNHYLSLILAMLAPIIASLLIVMVHLIFERRLKSARRYEDVPRLRSGTFSLFLVLLFLIYPSVSATILATFVCKTFDDGSRWLRKDITIDCDASDRVGWLVLASFGVIIYVAGVPMVYTYSLVRVRNEINPPDENQVPDRAKFGHVLFLTEIYKRKYWYWEVVELFRKLLQTSLVIFFLDGSVFQMIVMMIIAMVIVQVLNELKPYVNEGANRLASIAQWEILIVSFIGLLLRVDLSSLDSTFTYNKIDLLTGCLVAACFMAPIFAIFQKRRELFRFIVRRRCGTRKDAGVHEEAESALFNALLSPWSSAHESIKRRTSKESRVSSDAKPNSTFRESSSGGLENPIAVLERQSSLNAASKHVPGAMTRAANNPTFQEHQPRVVTFAAPDI